MTSKVRSESENSKQKDGELQNALETLDNQSGQTRSDNDAAGAARLLASLRIDLNEVIPPPPLAIVQELSPDDQRQIFSLGNISVITGKAKSRKTFALGMVTAAALGAINVPGKLKGTLPEGKRKVLYFDTEQSKYDAQLTAKRINEICGYSGKIDNFFMYGLRGVKPDKRRELVEYAIKNTPGIGLIVIDGVRDLVSSINDEEKATELISDLMAWSEQYGIHITNVLHQNKNNEQVRGWLGSEFINKAETVIAVKREPNDTSISTAIPEQTRKRPFEQFSFEIDNGQRFGIPVEADDVKARISKPKELTADDMTEDALALLTSNIFRHESELSASEIRTNIGVHMKKMYGLKVYGDNKQKSVLATLYANGFIDYRKEGRIRYYFKNVATEEAEM